MPCRDFTISVVVNVYNAPDRLSQCLDYLRRQSVQPDEILIADDGSGPETKAVIDAFAATTAIPVRHVWHEDDGFRRSAILNRAYAAARSEYIITVDCDILCHRHFIKDHCSFACRGRYVSGSVNWLTEKDTAAFAKSGNVCIPLKVRLKHPNSWRLPCLMSLVTRFSKQRRRYRFHTLKGGCNGMWRDDIIAVNGFNEDFTSWGYEDNELATRLYFHGINRRHIKHGAIAWHQWHPTSSRHNAGKNESLFREAIERKASRCEKGIDRYR